jgi:hypothetical protein
MLFNRMLKSCMSQYVRRNATLATMSALLWILMTFGGGIYPADGAAPSTTGLQENQSPILRPGGPSAATHLKAEARCDFQKRGGTGWLSWQSADLPGSQQRLDITGFRDGFQTGNFTIVGPLAPNQSEVKLDSGEPGINYYWRVLTLTEDGWVPSETERLPWPICPMHNRSP